MPLGGGYLKYLVLGARFINAPDSQGEIARAIKLLFVIPLLKETVSASLSATSRDQSHMPSMGFHGYKHLAEIKASDRRIISPFLS
jgi:hypothetical protein